jgi:hypothetical protein
MAEEALEELKTGYNIPPTPYREEDDVNRFWVRDLYDNAIPKQKGFITDLIYHMRGMEVPTMFTIWSALWLLSTVVKREAWLKWYPRPLYPNLYIILAAPAGFKKSVTIDEIGLPIIEHMQKYIAQPNIRRMKSIHVVKDKMTPEALLDAMLPGNKKGKASFVLVDDNGDPITDKHNRPIRYKATSEIGIVLSEMTSSIGKRSYTEGFVEILLDLYNPKDSWEWRTKGDGLKKFSRTYLSLLAATTPSAFKESVPKVAAGDGFLSRCVVIYQNATNRRYSIPRPVEGAPSLEELSMRLAWITEHGLGEFSLSKEAFHMYDDWYKDHKDFIEEHDNESGLRGRMDINLLKVATLLRMQRYCEEPACVITEADMTDAINLVHITYGMSAELLGELGDDLRRDAERIMRILDRYKSLTRIELLRKSHIPADDFNQIIDYLSQIGEISISLEGKVKSYPGKNGNELYTVSKLRENEMYERKNYNGRKENKRGN